MKRAIERCDTIFGCNPRDMPPTFTEYSAKIESLNMMARPIEITPQPPPDIDSDVRFLFIERSLDMNETICALETFHVFLQKHPNAHLTIIEKEPRNLQRTSYLEQHFRQRKTQIISWFPQEKLFVSYQHAHVFFFPSMEYQGLLVTEAIQFGFPTLCLKNDGPHSLNRDTSTSVPHQSENKENTQRALSTELEQLFAIKSREQYQPLQNATQEPYEKNLSVSSQVA
jgi:hypothetical protein